jgi:Arabinose efflux permease
MPQKGAWTIVVLLFFFMLINFADKVIIGLAGVPIMKDLALTPQEFGLVNSSFFFLFSLSAIATGFLVNHVQTRWVLLAMALVWALTQFPMLGTVSLGTLIACRIVLGAGEGPASPVALHATYKWFPNELRTLPTAVISQGAGVGVVIAIPVLSYVIEQFSWHWAFGLLGIVGLVWVVVWSLLGREGSAPAEIVDQSGYRIERVPYRRLLLNGTVLSGFAACFGSYCGIALLVGWFTPYLIDGLGYTQTEASWITTLPWAASPFFELFVGWFSQYLLAQGTSTRVARGLFGGGCVALGWRVPHAHALHAERRPEDCNDHRGHCLAGGDLHPRQRHGKRADAAIAAWRHARHQHRGRHLGRTDRALCHGQHGSERRRLTCRRVCLRLLHLRRGGPGLRRDRHDLPAAATRSYPLRNTVAPAASDRLVT